MLNFDLKNIQLFIDHNESLLRGDLAPNVDRVMWDALLISINGKNRSLYDLIEKRGDKEGPKITRATFCFRSENHREDMMRFWPEANSYEDKSRAEVDRYEMHIELFGIEKNLIDRLYCEGLNKSRKVSINIDFIESARRAFDDSSGLDRVWDVSKSTHYEIEQSSFGFRGAARSEEYIYARHKLDRYGWDGFSFMERTALSVLEASKGFGEVIKGIAWISLIYLFARSGIDLYEKYGMYFFPS
jgi:hypothetical protein